MVKLNLFLLLIFLLREFPTKDNKVQGAIEIFEMPQKVGDKIPNERYIMSLDNYENDYSETMSLGSICIRFMDR